jgi:peptidoglycan hydrolase CwlO-like protein
MWLKRNLPTLVIIGACIIVYTFFDKKESYVKEYDAKIEALEAKVDSLHAENDSLVVEADLLGLKLIESDKKIEQLNNNIYVIKKETKRQLDAVNSFSDDELEQFFTNRYQQSDSIN